jgi:hypothetical protein
MSLTRIVTVHYFTATCTCDSDNAVPLPILWPVWMGSILIIVVTIVITTDGSINLIDFVSVHMKHLHCFLYFKRETMVGFRTCSEGTV